MDGLELTIWEMDTDFAKDAKPLQFELGEISTDLAYIKDKTTLILHIPLKRIYYYHRLFCPTTTKPSF